MLTRDLVVAGAFAALGIALVQAHRANARDRDELASLRTSVDGLHTLVADAQATARVRRATAEAPLAPTPAPLPPAGAVASTAASSTSAAGHDDPARVEDPSAEELSRQRQQAFDAEPIDAAWAGETARSLQQALAATLSTGDMGGAVRTLLCHSASCRLELTVRDEAALDAFQREALYGANVLWRGPMSLSDEALPDGSIKVVSYLQR
jgi:hypothetical protein